MIKFSCKCNEVKSAMAAKEEKLNEKLSILMQGVKEIVQRDEIVEETDIDGKSGDSEPVIKPFSSVNMKDQYVDLSTSESTLKTCQLKAYFPEVFAEFRRIFKVSSLSYQTAFSSLPKIGVGKGRSGAKLFSTNDKCFVVKTLDRMEKKFLCKQYIPVFYEYVRSNSGVGNTLLPQFMGVYRFKKNRSRTYYIVMKNIFPANCPIKRKYDLKGCFIARKTADNEKIESGTTLKDQDFVDDGLRIKLKPDVLTKLLSTVEKDMQFLTRLNIMDYSLLIGIHERPTSDTCGEVDDIYYHVNTDMSDVIYFVAIIDVLTQYTLKKKMAHNVKVIRNRSLKPDISTINSLSYGERFLGFMKNCVFEQIV